MFSILPLLILVIVPGVQLFLSTNQATIATDRTILRFAQVYLTIFVGIQIPWIIGLWINWILSRKKDPETGTTSSVNENKFPIIESPTPSTNPSTNLSSHPSPTQSTMALPPSTEITLRTAIILTVALLLTWLQALKLRQGFYTPGPTTATNPPWFLQKPALYAGFFVPEVVVVIVYAVGGIRLRFLKPVREGGKGGSGGSEMGEMNEATGGVV
jgi:hypothetical protein